MYFIFLLLILHKVLIDCLSILCCDVTLNRNVLKRDLLLINRKENFFISLKKGISYHTQVLFALQMSTVR